MSEMTNNLFTASSWGQPPPVWEFRDSGKEIIQMVNSAPGIAIGHHRFGAVDYEGTMFVGCCADNDWIGAVFSFAVNRYISKFLLMNSNFLYGLRIALIFIFL